VNRDADVGQLGGSRRSQSLVVLDPAVKFADSPFVACNVCSCHSRSLAQPIQRGFSRFVHGGRCFAVLLLEGVLMLQYDVELLLKRVLQAHQLLKCAAVIEVADLLLTQTLGCLVSSALMRRDVVLRAKAAEDNVLRQM
jgi:hypothetical protein